MYNIVIKLFLEMIIINRLRELRQERGLNMAEVARNIGIPYTTYVSYEKNEREPNSEMLIMFSDFYGCSVDYLIGKCKDRVNDRVLDIVNTLDDDVLINSNGNSSEAKSKQMERNEDFTAHEKEVIFAYRSHPEMQTAIDTLLGLEEKKNVQVVKIAARSGIPIEERPLTDSEIELFTNGKEWHGDDEL